MTSKRPLAFLLVALMAIGMVSMFAAAPVAAQSNNDCNAYSTSGDAVATGSSLAVSASSASVSATQIASQNNLISNTESGSGSASQGQVGMFVQANSANQNQC